MTHTPGPWKIVNDGEQETIWANAWEIARDIDSIDNARLIAAAPDLLEALKECLDYIVITMEGEEISQYPTERSAIKHAGAAIAKAEGK